MRMHLTFASGFLYLISLAHCQAEITDVDIVRCFESAREDRFLEVAAECEGVDLTTDVSSPSVLLKKSHMYME